MKLPTTLIGLATLSLLVACGGGNGGSATPPEDTGTGNTGGQTGTGNTGGPAADSSGINQAIVAVRNSNALESTEGRAWPAPARFEGNGLYNNNDGQLQFTNPSNHVTSHPGINGIFTAEAQVQPFSGFAGLSQLYDAKFIGGWGDWSVFFTSQVPSIRVTSTDLGGSSGLGGIDNRAGYVTGHWTTSTSEAEDRQFRTGTWNGATIASYGTRSGTSDTARFVDVLGDAQITIADVGAFGEGASGAVMIDLSNFRRLDDGAAFAPLHAGLRMTGDHHNHYSPNSDIHPTKEIDTYNYHLNVFGPRGAEVAGSYNYVLDVQNCATCYTGPEIISEQLSGVFGAKRQ